MQSMYFLHIEVVKYYFAIKFYFTLFFVQEKTLDDLDEYVLLLETHRIKVKDNAFVFYVCGPILSNSRPRSEVTYLHIASHPPTLSQSFETCHSNDYNFNHYNTVGSKVEGSV